VLFKCIIAGRIRVAAGRCGVNMPATGGPVVCSWVENCSRQKWSGTSERRPIASIQSKKDGGVSSGGTMEVQIKDDRRIRVESPLEL